MQKSFRSIWLLILAISFGLAISAPAIADQGPTITGVYSVSGTNPGSATRYRGTATISKQDGLYRMHWRVGTQYDGVGNLVGNTFTVEWGTATAHVGTVTYVLQPDGVMKGTWYTAKNPNLLGTENLIPQK